MNILIIFSLKMSNFLLFLFLLLKFWLCFCTRTNISGKYLKFYKISYQNLLVDAVCKWQTVKNFCEQCTHLGWKSVIAKEKLTPKCAYGWVGVLCEGLYWIRHKNYFSLITNIFTDKQYNFDYQCSNNFRIQLS